MSSILNWLSGKKTYLLVLAYVGIQLYNNGGLDALAPSGDLQNIVLAAAVAALRAGVSKAVDAVASKVSPSAPAEPPAPAA